MAITTSRYEKDLIRQEALALGARRMLEIGAFKGHTTAVLNRVAVETDGYVAVIDPMKWASRPAHFFEWIDGLLHPFSYEPAFWRNVERSGPNRVHLARGCSTDPAVLDDPHPKLAEFDLVFIDGEHLYDTVRADVRNWGGRVRVGGKVLLHDTIRRFPGVCAVVRELERDPRYRVRWPSRGSIAVVDVVAPAVARPAPVAEPVTTAA